MAPVESRYEASVAQQAHEWTESLQVFMGMMRDGVIGGIGLDGDVVKTGDFWPKGLSALLTGHEAPPEEPEQFENAPLKLSSMILPPELREQQSAAAAEAAAAEAALQDEAASTDSAASAIADVANLMLANAWSLLGQLPATTCKAPGAAGLEAELRLPPPPKLGCAEDPEEAMIEALMQNPREVAELVSECTAAATADFGERAAPQADVADSASQSNNATFGTAVYAVPGKPIAPVVESTPLSSHEEHNAAALLSSSAAATSPQVEGNSSSKSSAVDGPDCTAAAEAAPTVIEDSPDRLYGTANWLPMNAWAPASGETVVEETAPSQPAASEAEPAQQAALAKGRAARPSGAGSRRRGGDRASVLSMSAQSTSAIGQLLGPSVGGGRRRNGLKPV